LFAGKWAIRREMEFKSADRSTGCPFQGICCDHCHDFWKEKENRRKTVEYRRKRVYNNTQYEKRRKLS